MKDKKIRNEKKSPKISKTQIKIGAKHELEHTKSIKRARKIAKDHLVEIPDYYKPRLQNLEKQAKKEGKFRKVKKK